MIINWKVWLFLIPSYGSDFGDQAHGNDGKKQ